MIGSVERSQSSVRSLASEILAQVDTQKAYADILLDRTLKDRQLQERDRALLTEIVYGTLRWRGRLDAELSCHLRRPLSKIDAWIRNLLRLAAYQLLFLDRVPDYAAVSEAVEIAKLHRSAKTAGFVNAVLRNLLRVRDRAVISGREEHSNSTLTIEYSHPEWLVKKWRQEFGLQSTINLMRANNEKAPLVIRVNPLRCSRERLLEAFSRAGISAAPTRCSPSGISVQSAGAVENFPGFSEGWFQVQGESSQLVALLLSPLPGERNLEACAAPGGKATHIAELMKNRGKLIAIDKSAPGLVKLRDNMTRLDITCIEAYRADAGRALDDSLSGPYDRILVDAPCSGLGTLRAHPEIKWHRNQADIQRLSFLQSKILDRVAPCLKRGGTLVYATCTLTYEENEQNLEAFLVRHDEFELQDAARYLPNEARHMTKGKYFEALPHRDNTDGFFAARMKKVS